MTTFKALLLYKLAEMLDAPSTPEVTAHFPFLQSQQIWKYKHGDGKLSLKNGESTYTFSFPEKLVPENEDENGTFPINRLKEDNHAGMSGTERVAQVHRAHPGEIYVTLHEGHRNPTYTLKHEGEDRWKATLKKKVVKKIQEIAQELKVPEVSKESTWLQDRIRYNEKRSGSGFGLPGAQMAAGMNSMAKSMGGANGGALGGAFTGVSHGGPSISGLRGNGSGVQSFVPGMHPYNSAPAAMGGGLSSVAQKVSPQRPPPTIGQPRQNNSAAYSRAFSTGGLSNQQFQAKADSFKRNSAASNPQVNQNQTMANNAFMQKYPNMNFTPAGGMVGFDPNSMAGKSNLAIGNQNQTMANNAFMQKYPNMNFAATPGVPSFNSSTLAGRNSYNMPFKKEPLGPISSTANMSAPSVTSK